MLEQLVSWLAYGSLAIAAISAYLHLNKLWSRKHIPEVAASISISGTILEAVPTIIFGLYFLTKLDPVGVIDAVIWLLAAIGFIMIGSGFWVKGQRKRGFWQLAWRSLNSESGEIGNLARSIIHPASSEQLITLLKRLAEVDGEVSVEEAALVNQVAADMDIEVEIEPHSVTADRTTRLLNIREALSQYLETSPPKSNVEQLEQLLRQLSDSDGQDHADEQIAADEVRALINDYLNDETTAAPFRVLLAPQSESQVTHISELLMNAPIHASAGGRGITVGEFHSREYADTVCKDYRKLGFFCVVTDELIGAPAGA